jgi:hypothetical protein
MSRVAPMGIDPPEYDRPDGKDPDHMGKVAQLPCVVCYHHGLTQQSRTTVHHCIHGRYSGRKVPDRQTIPLCDGHHQGRWDNTKIAIHNGKETWRLAYGIDTDFIAWTLEQIEERT